MSVRRSVRNHFVQNNFFLGRLQLNGDQICVTVPCPTTILPLPTRTQPMLPYIRPCYIILLFLFPLNRFSFVHAKFSAAEYHNMTAAQIAQKLGWHVSEEPGKLIALIVIFNYILTFFPFIFFYVHYPNKLRFFFCRTFNHKHY